MKTYSHKIISLVLGASLLTLSSCGGGGGGGGGGGQGGKTSEPHRVPKPPHERQQETLETELVGQYRAILKPLNESVAGVTTGSVTLARDEDQIIGYVRFSGVQPEVLHTQHVHVAKSCPSNDENGDGIIDAVESDKTVGKVLIPLDADISSQDRGSSIWPVSDAYGYYHWTQVTKYNKMMEDLRDGDLDPEDDFIKLGADKNIDMSGRVVVIYGVAKSTALPATVARRGRLANYQNLPIACGVFEKIKKVPGTLDNDRDLGEIAPGESIGGSSGADDGATVIIGESSGGSTGTETSGTGGGVEGWTTGGSTGWTEGGTAGGEPDTTTTGGVTTGGITTGGESTGGAIGGWTEGGTRH